MIIIVSLIFIVQGVIDLFRLPYEQYQRDGRIVRGIQLGAQSFTSRTALAALELTTRLIYLLQVSVNCILCQGYNCHLYVFCLNLFFLFNSIVLYVLLSDNCRDCI